MRGILVILQFEVSCGLVLEANLTHNSPHMLVTQKVNLKFIENVVWSVDNMSRAKSKSSKEGEKLSLLFELIKGSRRSDRELAKALGVSQPSVSRKRTQLEKDGFIKEYTILPDLDKMGYQLMVFTSLAFSQPLTTEILTRARQWVEKQPCIVFWADGEGSGMGSLMISVHKDYASFSRLLSQFKLYAQTDVKDIQNFYVSLARKELFVRTFSFRYLEDDKQDRLS